MAARYSIIIPTLNEEKFLPKLLASLAAQTDRHFEVIVVDGTSKDKTVAIAKTFAKKLPKLNIIVSPTASLPLQRNIGARKARGEWLIFIDADSVVVPHFIARITEFIKEESPSFFVTWMRPDSNKPGEANITLLGNMMFEVAIALRKPVPSGPLTAVTRKAFEKVGGYDESHAYHEDIDFSLRVIQAGFSHHVIPETLFTWSLRRFRKQGTPRVIQQYVASAFPLLLFNRPLKYMPGYIMGGQLYGKKQQSALKKYEKKFRLLLKEFFE